MKGLSMHFSNNIFDETKIIFPDEDLEFVKDFDSWIDLKKDMDILKKTPTISEGDVWWCGVGANVGIEISGKSSRFSRPIVIMKKLNKFGFMGIPLTSKPKTGPWYISFKFQGVKETAAICQARVMSVFRLYSRMGRLPESDLEKIKKGFHALYS